MLHTVQQKSNLPVKLLKKQEQRSCRFQLYQNTNLRISFHTQPSHVTELHQTFMLGKLGLVD